MKKIKTKIISGISLALIVFNFAFAAIPSIEGKLNVVAEQDSFVLFWDKVYKEDGESVEDYEILMSDHSVMDGEYYDEFVRVRYSEEGVRINNYGKKLFEKGKKYYFSVIAVSGNEKSEYYSMEISGELGNATLNEINTDLKLLNEISTFDSVKNNVASNDASNDNNYLGEGLLEDGINTNVTQTGDSIESQTGSDIENIVVKDDEKTLTGLVVTNNEVISQEQEELQKLWDKYSNIYGNQDANTESLNDSQLVDSQKSEDLKASAVKEDDSVGTNKENKIVDKVVILDNAKPKSTINTNSSNDKMLLIVSGILGLIILVLGGLWIYFIVNKRKKDIINNDIINIQDELKSEDDKLESASDLNTIVTPVSEIEESIAKPEETPVLEVKTEQCELVQKEETLTAEEIKSEIVVNSLPTVSKFSLIKDKIISFKSTISGSISSFVLKIKNVAISFKNYIAVGISSIIRIIKEFFILIKNSLISGVSSFHIKTKNLVISIKNSLFAFTSKFNVSLKTSFISIKIRLSELGTNNIALVRDITGNISIKFSVYLKSFVEFIKKLIAKIIAKFLETKQKIHDFLVHIKDIVLTKFKIGYHS